MPETSIAKNQISLRANDRVFICGKTGTGKTYLARHLTQRLTRLVVLDGKGTLGSWELEPWDREARRALKANEPIRTRVVLGSVTGDPVDYWVSVLETLYSVSNVTIYIDEVYMIIDPGTRAPAIFTALYTQGRELGIGVWAATQRPTWIPLVCMSEAEHFWMFRLNLEEDRKRMSAFMGPDVMQPIRDVHGYYYMRDVWDDPIYQAKFDSASVKKGGTANVGDGRS